MIHGQQASVLEAHMLRTIELPNGLFLIHHQGTGLTAVANEDGSYRHGVKAIWERWRASEDVGKARRTGSIPPLGTLGA